MVKGVSVKTNTVHHSKDWDHLNDRLDNKDEASLHPVTNRLQITTHRVRLIDASCAAFLIKRGLDPEIIHRRLTSALSEKRHNSAALQKIISEQE